MKVILRKGENVRSLAKEEFTILVNVKFATWTRVTDVALNIINMVENLELGRAIRTIGENFNVNQQQAEVFIEFMTERGILKKEEKFEALEPIELDNNSEAGLAHCYLHLTKYCNLRCGYCSYNAGENYDKEQLPTSKFKSIIRRLAINKISQLVFAGGEPLCSEDFFEIVKYARDFFPELGMVTNGTLINSENAEFITKYIDKVQISLDSGVRQEHDLIRGEGSYDKTINGIKLLKQCGHQHVKIAPTTNKININNIEEIVRVAKNLDVMLDIRFFLPIGRGCCNEDEFSISYEQRADVFKRVWRECKRIGYDKYSIKHFNDAYVGIKTSCGICQQKICVDVNGEIYPCAFLMEDSFKIGNIFDRVPIMETIKLSSIGKELMVRDVDNIEGCKTCEVRYFCGGGCLAVNEGGCTAANHGEAEFCKPYRDLMSKFVWNFDGDYDKLLNSL